MPCTASHSSTAPWHACSDRDTCPAWTATEKELKQQSTLRRTPTYPIRDWCLPISLDLDDSLSNVRLLSFNHWVLIKEVKCSKSSPVLAVGSAYPKPSFSQIKSNSAKEVQPPKEEKRSKAPSLTCSNSCSNSSLASYEKSTCPGVSMRFSKYFWPQKGLDSAERLHEIRKLLNRHSTVNPEPFQRRLTKFKHKSSADK